VRAFLLSRLRVRGGMQCCRRMVTSLPHCVAARPRHVSSAFAPFDVVVAGEPTTGIDTLEGQKIGTRDVTHTHGHGHGFVAGTGAGLRSDIPVI
jgi:hypothetical protein